MLVQFIAFLALAFLPNGTVDDLEKGSVVRVGLRDNESIIGEVVDSNDESVICLDLETWSQLKSIVQRSVSRLRFSQFSQLPSEN